MEFVVLMAVLTGLMGMVYLWMRSIQKRSHLPPGPMAWPLVGNMLQIDPIRPHITLSELADHHGDVFTFSAFGNPVVVGNSYDAIFEIYVSKSNDFAGRPRAFTSSYIHNMSADTAFPDFTPDWARRKKIFQTNIKMYGDGLHHLEAVMVDILKELCHDIREMNEEPFDPIEHIQLAIANTLTLLLFGSKFKKGEPDFQKLLVYMEQGLLIMAPSLVYFALNAFPLLRYLPVPVCQRLDQFLSGFVKDWIPRQWDKRTVQSQKEDVKTPACVLDGIVKQFEQDLTSGESYPLEHKHILGMCENFTMAGMHTSSAALYALLATLTAHPDVQSKAQAQIDQVLGDRQVTLSDKDDMHYIRAVLEEIMRYAVVVALGVPHKATVDTNLRGHFIPKGTEVWANVWYLCHDHKFWGDPWKFRPERFLDDKGELISIDHPYRKHLLVFGAGRRVCPGEVLAKNRIFLIATTLLQKFTFKPKSEGEMPTYDPRTYTTGISVYPAHYQIRAIPRA